MNRLTFDAEGKITNSLAIIPKLCARRQGGKRRVDRPQRHEQAILRGAGPRGRPLAFAGNDTTHHSDYGSYELAKCIVEGFATTSCPSPNT